MSSMDTFKSWSGYNMLDSFMHPERGYDDASKEYEKSWREAQGYGQPYNQHGMDEYGRLSGATGKLLDPAALQAEWMKSYETSPYAQDELKRSKDVGLDAASSMGLGASSAGLENIQRTGSHIVNADRQQYLNDLMNKYTLGTGLSQNIYGTGANTAQWLGQGAMRQGDRMGEARYGAATAPGALFGNIAGTAAGYAVGGPIGGALANKYIGSYQPWGG